MRSSSVVSVGSSSSESCAASSASPSPAKRRKPNPATKPKSSAAQPTRKAKADAKDPLVDLEDLAPSVSRPHGRAYHDVARVADRQEDLLNWFEQVRSVRNKQPGGAELNPRVTREKRGMPWRKRYEHDLTQEKKGQRAYEVSLLRESFHEPDCR